MENKLLRPIQSWQIESNKEKQTFSVLHLQQQRFLHDTSLEKKAQRISLMVDEEEEPLGIQELKLNLNDPLRLNLIEQQVEEQQQEKQQIIEEEEDSQSLFPFFDLDQLPYHFKPSSTQLELELLSNLYIPIDHKSTDDENYLKLVYELPFATAAFIPPTPPPKETSSTPASSPPIILPYDAYASVYDDVQSESLSQYSPPSPRFTKESEAWEAIFHPLSTFKHHKGELEYYAWNPTNLPEAAARVAQRVLHSKSQELPNNDLEPTIPQIMPTPPLKPSPVLTMASSKEVELIQTSPGQQAIVLNEAGHYDMLQKIRANSSSSLSDTTTISENHIALLFGKKKKYKEVQDPEIQLDVEQKNWSQKRLFWTGFLCPLCWYIGSFYIRTAHHPTNKLWQKRCRMAALYFSIAMSIVILVASVKAAGAAATRLSQTDTIRAVIAD